MCRSALKVVTILYVLDFQTETRNDPDSKAKKTHYVWELSYLYILYIHIYRLIAGCAGAYHDYSLTRGESRLHFLPVRDTQVHSHNYFNRPTTKMTG